MQKAAVEGGTSQPKQLVAELLLDKDLLSERWSQVLRAGGHRDLVAWFQDISEIGRIRMAFTVVPSWITEIGKVPC